MVVYDLYKVQIVKCLGFSRQSQGNYRYPAIGHAHIIMLTLYSVQSLLDDWLAAIYSVFIK